MDIGKEIQKYRKLNNLTQKELAQKCGLATGTIQKYELGKIIPRTEQLKKISEVLNININELIYRDKIVINKITKELLDEHEFLKFELLNTVYYLLKNSGNSILCNYATILQQADNNTVVELLNALISKIIVTPDFKELKVYFMLDIENVADDESNNLLHDYKKLNKEGQEEARKQVKNLTKIEEYTKNNN